MIKSFTGPIFHSAMETLPEEDCIQEDKEPWKNSELNQERSQKFKENHKEKASMEQELKHKSVTDSSLKKCSGRCTGTWYDRMLECQRCKQWFHDTCVGCLTYKLIHGDRFYLYVCGFCNNGKEFLHRLSINWEDIVHLALWNLTISTNLSKNGTFFDYKEQIYPWVNNHWELLQCSTELLTIPIKDRTQHILWTLEGNSIKFRCGKEFRKKVCIWKLRSRNPPTIPDIILPPESPFTEAMMHRISYCERATELPPIPKTFKVDVAEIDMRVILKQQVEASCVADLDKKDDKNNGLEFNTHVCLQCKSCVESLDQYVTHIRNGCSTAEEDEQNTAEDFKKKEHQLKKELSALKINVVEKEGQLKDIQNKILRHERTGHKVKTAQLKIKSEEVAISKKEMKQLKLKYNKLLCYLKEHEHEIDQTEKKGDTPEKMNDQKSPKGKKKISFSKVSSVKFSDKIHSPENRREISKEKNRLIIQNSLFKKSKKEKKEQTNVIDSGRHLLENPLSILACSETVCTNLKESSVVGINPKHNKTNKNYSIKDNKFSFSNKIKHGSNKQEKAPSLEPISDLETDSNQFLDTQDEVSPVSPLMNIKVIKHNIAGKAKDSLDLYRKTDKSCDDKTNEAQSSCYKSMDDGIKVNEHKDQEKKSEKPLQPILKNAKSVCSTSQESTIEFINSRQSITIVDSRIALSKDPECPTNVVKVENVEHHSQISTKKSNNNNDSVVFLKQIQLPPNNEIRVVPRVSTPIFKEEKLDFVDPELSAIISGEEVSHGVDESVYILSTDTSEDPKESEGHIPLNTNSSEVNKESEGIISIKKERNITEHVYDKNASFEQELKDQAKDESHNEAMILETDLDDEVGQINNNSNQCLDDNGNISIYSPQDPIETLSLSGSEFLTVSEASKSPSKAEISTNLDSDNRINSDKAVGIHSKNNNFSRPDKNEKSHTLKKDVESDSAKTSEFIPLSEETSGLRNNVEKLPTATVKPLNTASTKLTKDEASRRDKRKLNPEGSGGRDKRTKISAPNANDGVRHPSNSRPGGSNSSIYQGDRFRPSFDPNHHPRSGVLRVPYQQPSRVPYQQPSRPPWHPRGTNNYRPRMHNQNPYSFYRW